MHHDAMHYYPMSRGPIQGSRHGLLAMNHEYIDTDAAHPTGATWIDGVRDRDQVRKEIAAHGVSVVEIVRVGDRWRTVRGRYNRRITAATRMEIAGPARGHRNLRTAYSPAGTHTRGTINNCAHGVTPWGTYLTCEENWAGYFVNRGTRPREHSRYGVSATVGRYGWESVEDRFDATSIQTDMSGSQLNSGPFGNNQMLVANPKTGQLKRFLVGPAGCEVTGVTATPDQRTMFVNIQHPGEDGGVWPAGGLKARSATIVVTRKDGCVIGT